MKWWERKLRDWLGPDPEAHRYSRPKGLPLLVLNQDDPEMMFIWTNGVRYNFDLAQLRSKHGYLIVIYTR